MTTRFRAHGVFALLSAIQLPLAVGCSRTLQAEAEPETGVSEVAGASRAERRDTLFRCATSVNTMYFLLRGDGTYSFIAREHRFTMELDKGSWEQDANGELTLTSGTKRRGGKYHLTPLLYRSLVVLTSPDHDLVKIHAATAEEVKKRIDKLGPGEQPHHLFVSADVGSSEREWKTPQPFIIYPELNKIGGPHPVLKLQ